MLCINPKPLNLNNTPPFNTQVIKRRRFVTNNSGIKPWLTAVIQPCHQFTGPNCSGLPGLVPNYSFKKNSRGGSGTRKLWPKNSLADTLGNGPVDPLFLSSLLPFFRIWLENKLSYNLYSVGKTFFLNLSTICQNLSRYKR